MKFPCQDLTPPPIPPASCKVLPTRHAKEPQNGIQGRCYGGDGPGSDGPVDAAQRETRCPEVGAGQAPASGRTSSRPGQPGTLHQPRAVLAGLQPSRSRGGRESAPSAAGAAALPVDQRVEPR